MTNKLTREELSAIRNRINRDRRAVQKTGRHSDGTLVSRVRNRSPLDLKLMPAGRAHVMRASGWGG